MIKSAHLYLGLAALLALPAIVPAQDNSAALAVNEAVRRQATAIELHSKLAEAAATAQRNNIIDAAKLYQEAVTQAQDIGSPQPETQQAIAGLAATSLALAREAQSRGDYTEANTRVALVLKADPKNQAAILFKMQNDKLIAQTNGHRPDAQTTETIPAVMNQKTQAGTLVQDGKLLYEMGKLDEADAKLTAAVKLDPDNVGAYYYQNLVKQARYTRDLTQHSVDTQTRMEQVEKQWVLPKSSAQLPPIGNPYATNNLIYTGPGRQAIVAKLDHIRLDTVSYDGLPLSEVVRQLSEQSRLRDPERKGINFLINPNADQSGPAIVAANGGGFGGGLGGVGGAPAPAPAAIDPATGLPAAPAGGAGGGGEKVDIGTAITVKLALTDVRLADVLDAIVMVCEHPDGHPIKYSIQDFAVVFADKGSFEPVPLFTRTFKVDPNTFYSGLESVGSSSFGGGNSSSGGGGGGGGGSRGGGGGGGSSGQNQGGAVVGVVNAFAGAGGLRNQGGQGGGGGGGSGQGSTSVLQGNGTGTGGGGGGGSQNQGGLNYITTQTLANTPSTIARAFFTALGVNLDQPAGKSVFFNDKSGLLFVKATESDLDTIDKAIQTLNQVAPQVHIKARFIEVSQDDSKALGFDWYLGQFNVGNQVVGTGGSSPSLTVPTSAANPLLPGGSSAFPGNTSSSLVPSSGNDQLITSGLRNSGPTIGTLTGILTDPNFRVALHALEQRGGFETLGEPEITTMSGRQAQMRATQVVTVITDFNFQQGTGGIQQNTGGTTQ
ncbi:MAG: hypothetical protein P4N60_02090 [Verrucomicrobiae bacterium]|nr:hypothetical protein [Verrucomicrobiae bacterium]